MTIINKIGGSCLRSVDDYQKIPQIINNTPCILIVSASYGTTQILLDCLHLASEQKKYVIKLNKLINTHRLWNKHLTNDHILEQTLLQDKKDILVLLHSIALLGTYSPQQKDGLLGYGEYWSSKLIASILGVPWVDAGQIITINLHEDIITVNWIETKKRLNKALEEKHAPVVVMPGFVARNAQGHRAFLGFNGSDFTAAIIAKLIKATLFIKWTDSDGVYTADSILVKSAFAIPELSYQEASELAYFGTSVLHYQSIQPIIASHIPIYVKNYFKINSPGTTICSNPKKSGLVVKGLRSISEIALINIEGTELIGLCSLAGRLFSALSKSEIPVVLISPTSSDHSIRIAVKAELSIPAIQIIHYKFNLELVNKLILNIELIEDCAVISAVGNGLYGKPGIAAKFFAMLYRANINILAVAQDSFERNISAVIKAHQIQHALQVLHGGFYLSNKTLSIGLIGPGDVGSQLLGEITKNRNRLEREMNVDFQVRGIMNSKFMVLNEKNMEFNDWKVGLKSHSISKNLESFITHIASQEIPHSVIIDCSPSAELAQQYVTILEKGCHIITPNKKANSSPLSEYKKLKTSIAQHNRHYLYETTVCAGLPVIKTIQDLIATGDKIKRIEGIVSGTLSYIFNQCTKGFSFAQSVKEAYELGYTESDPREDLNGLDVARKFICLARELSYEIILEDVSLLNMVPEALKNESIANFLKNLNQHTASIENKIKKLLENNTGIAYVGVIEYGKIKLQLKGYPLSHPFAHISGTDNILLIQSRRYNKQPL